MLPGILPRVTFLGVECVASRTERGRTKSHASFFLAGDARCSNFFFYYDFIDFNYSFPAFSIMEKFQCNESATRLASWLEGPGGWWVQVADSSPLTPCPGTLCRFSLLAGEALKSGSSCINLSGRKSILLSPWVASIPVAMTTWDMNSLSTGVSGWDPRNRSTYHLEFLITSMQWAYTSKTHIFTLCPLQDIPLYIISSPSVTNLSFLSFPISWPSIHYPISSPDGVVNLMYFFYPLERFPFTTVLTCIWFGLLRCSSPLVNTVWPLIKLTWVFFPSVSESQWTPTGIIGIYWGRGGKATGLGGVGV